MIHKERKHERDLELPPRIPWRRSMRPVYTIHSSFFFEVQEHPLPWHCKATPSHSPSNSPSLPPAAPPSQCPLLRPPRRSPGATCTGPRPACPATRALVPPCVSIGLASCYRLLSSLTLLLPAASTPLSEGRVRRCRRDPGSKQTAERWAAVVAGVVAGAVVL
ncbi:hypothetical protein VTK73DRAFT_6494 [Phialemonium thermophilum]|uniref:Uncharacterized protein n=1 Tax=Phialemonium thermophilum TaxID=223376 RepID=A0ABR3UZN3_9PEZI